MELCFLGCWFFVAVAVTVVVVNYLQVHSMGCSQDGDFPPWGRDGAVKVAFNGHPLALPLLCVSWGGASPVHMVHWLLLSFWGSSVAISRGQSGLLWAASPLPRLFLRCPAAPYVMAAVGTGVAVAGPESRWMRQASCPWSHVDGVRTRRRVQSAETVGNCGWGCLANGAAAHSSHLKVEGSSQVRRISQPGAPGQHPEPVLAVWESQLQKVTFSMFCSKTSKFRQCCSSFCPTGTNIQDIMRLRYPGFFFIQSTQTCAHVGTQTHMHTCRHKHKHLYTAAYFFS